MCVAGCREVVEANLSRRAFLGVAAAAAPALMASCQGVGAVESRARRGDEAAAAPVFPAFGRVVDLTHTYSNSFPHFNGQPARVDLETVLSTERGDGWNMKLWTLDEHAGTHVDAPYHRNSAGVTVEKIPARDLVLPLCVIDIREAARRDRDYRASVEDLRNWEQQHGPLPARACVALWSGWEAKVSTPEFFGIDSKGLRHFPGFHVDTVEMLLKERDVVALAADTASFDHGPTTEFPAHTLWLGANRWALENAAGLGEVPPRGATIVCGAPKIAGATGGPSRVFALV